MVWGNAGQDHAIAARYPVNRGSQAARGGELKGVDRANDLVQSFGAGKRGSGDREDVRGLRNHVFCMPSPKKR